MPGKRERLVRAAQELVHRQGYHRTTLAEIAQAAQVPVGNVYYYFNTKDALLRAVIAARVEEARALLDSLAAHRDPRERLKALARCVADDSEAAAHHGCPYGSLSQELDKSACEAANPAAELLRLHVDWAEEQFALVCGAPEARELAVEFESRLQGASLLTSAFRSPDLLARQVRRLEAWIDSLC